MEGFRSVEARFLHFVQHKLLAWDVPQDVPSVLTLISLSQNQRTPQDVSGLEPLGMAQDGSSQAAGLTSQE